MNRKKNIISNKLRISYAQHTNGCKTGRRTDFIFFFWMKSILSLGKTSLLHTLLTESLEYWFFRRAHRIFQEPFNIHNPCETFLSFLSFERNVSIMCSRLSCQCFNCWTIAQMISPFFFDQNFSKSIKKVQSYWETTMTKKFVSFFSCEENHQVETKREKKSTMISMSHAPLRLPQILYMLVYMIRLSGENFYHSVTVAVCLVALPRPVHVYRPSTWKKEEKKTNKNENQRLENIINYTTFIAWELLYLHTVPLFTCVQMRCACEPRVFILLVSFVFRSLFFFIIII